MNAFKDLLVQLKLRYNKLIHDKHSYELRYWTERFELEGNKLNNDI